MRQSDVAGVGDVAAVGWRLRRHRQAPASLALIGLVLLTGCSGSAVHELPGREIPGANPGRGREALTRYGCGACHQIPGVTGARGAVGPPLTSFSKRTIVAGRLANTPDNLTRWIQEPQAVEPGTAMPNLGVSNADARDIAAYLYTLE